MFVVYRIEEDIKRSKTRIRLNLVYSAYFAK